MQWKIDYSNEARKDLESVFVTIAYDFLELTTAKKQVERIMKAVRSLDLMPLRHSIYDEEPLKSKNLRFLPIDNYIIFYIPYEETHTVSIVRILPGGMDIKAQFK